MTVFDLVATLRLDSTEYENGLRDARNDTEKTGNSIKDTLISVGKAFAGAAITKAVIDFGKAALDTGMQFDTAMSQVAATLGMTTAEISNNVDGAGDKFNALREKALEMGSSTNFTAQQAAEGLNILAMSGYNATDSIAMIEDVLHLAAAGSMDMASAAQYVTGAMKGFGDETKTSEYYADLMAKGATLAATNVTELGEALSGSAASAKSYGQDAETVTLALLRLAEQGETGSAAATALSAAMKNLYAPTDQAAAVLQQLGVSAFDPTNGKARNFNDVINELNVALSGYTDEQRTALAQTIFGIQGFDAYNKMVVTSTEKQQEWSEELANSTGEAAKQYDTMTDNLKGDIDEWNSALDGFKIMLSDVLTPVIRTFVSGATQWLSDLTNAFKEGGLTGVLDTISGWITEKSPLLGIAFDTVRETVSTAFTTIKEVWENVLLPALQAFHDFVNGTLAPKIQNVIDTIIKPAFERFGESVRTVWENIIKPAFDALRAFVVETLAPAITTAWQETIQPAIETVSTAIQTAWENVIKPAFEALWKFTTETLAPKIKEAWETTIQPTIEAVGNIIQSVWENIIKPAWEAMQKLVGETLAPKIKEAWETTIKPAVETVGKAIETIWTNTIKPAWDSMNTRMNEVAENLKGAWETTIQPAIETVGKAIETIWTNTIKPAIEAFSKFTTETLAPAIKDAWENLIQPTIEGVGKIIQATWEGVIKPAWDAMKKLVIDTLAPKIKEAWETIIKPAIETVGKIIEEIWTNTIRPAWEAMNSKMDEVAAAISDAWNTIIQPAIETVASAISAAWTNVIQPAWQAISDAVGVLGSTVQSVWTTVIQPAVETVGGVISGVWTGVIQPAWQGLLDSLGVISQNFNEFLTTATTIWNGVRDAIVSPIQTAESWIGEIVGRLKGIFNFEWSLPKLKMPHFTIDWVDIGGIISLPSITVEWYRKAYDNPFMFNSPTMMGFGDGVGGEMVYGHESLMNDIKSAVQQVVGTQEENDRPIVVQCVLDGRIISESVATYQTRRARAFG